MARAVLAEDIADQLRRDILSGRLEPGQPIKERDRAVEMEVSRTPMREAVRILAKEGLVTLRPARSPIVANPSFAEIADWIAVLRALETLSGALACRNASDGEIAAIRAMHERIGGLYGRIDTLELFEIDMGLHVAIARASHNAALAETHGAYLARLWRARYLSARQRKSRERVLGQHGRIVEALEARDEAATRAAIDAHLDALAENVRAFYEGGGGTARSGGAACAASP
ncbi:MAG: GntR family transcriptional regulator, partial [Pseudomonadota bacterium]